VNATQLRGWASRSATPLRPTPRSLVWHPAGDAVALDAHRNLPHYHGCPRARRDRGHPAPRHLEFAPVLGNGRRLSLLSDGQLSLLYISSSSPPRPSAVRPRRPTHHFDIDGCAPRCSSARGRGTRDSLRRILGRVLAALARMADGHARRQSSPLTHRHSCAVEPTQVRYLRLVLIVARGSPPWRLPDETDEAHKFVRERLHAYPELYFAPAVVLGEGDSEEVVLPLSAGRRARGRCRVGLSGAPRGPSRQPLLAAAARARHPACHLARPRLGRTRAAGDGLKYAADQLLRYVARTHVAIT
jgi:putative ATP-dependent endonuclease of OLD family